MKLFGGGSYTRIKTRSLYSYRKTLFQNQRLIHWINMLNTLKVNNKDSRTTSIEVVCSAVFIPSFEFTQVISPILPQHKKWSFALSIFSVNLQCLLLRTIYRGIILQLLGKTLKTKQAKKFTLLLVEKLFHLVLTSDFNFAVFHSFPESCLKPLSTASSVFYENSHC